MAGMLRIEPVGPGDRGRALALLAGSPGRPSADSGAAHLEALLSGPQASRYKLWWARTLRGGRVAAMTVRNPGRTAMLVYGPAGRSAGAVLAGLLSELTAAALAEDVSFVQAMLAAGADADVQAFVQAGYVFLAELTYLRRELRRPPEERAASLAWPCFARGDEGRLARIIQETYLGSQDCPALRRLRRIEDVVTGHKSTGLFRPKSWWTPAQGGECVGCVLVNDAAEDAGAAEVVYLGVRPAYRRRGFGRAMLAHALADAWRRGLRRMNIAVDAANTPAVRLYRGEGFRQVDRREVYIKPSSRASTGLIADAAGGEA